MARKVVHVYGGSLKRALLGNFDGVQPALFGTLFECIVAWQIRSARARFEHDFAYDVCASDNSPDCRLPTPVPLAGPHAKAGPDSAAVYLNPHFRDTRLADALCAGIADAGLDAHRVGEGYAGRDGWVGIDADWASHAAQARVIVSAPGMAALSIALVYGRPIVLVLTDQPEQASNARRAAQLAIPHRIVVCVAMRPTSAIRSNKPSAPLPTPASATLCRQWRPDASRPRPASMRGRTACWHCVPPGRAPRPNTRPPPPHR